MPIYRGARRSSDQYLDSTQAFPRDDETTDEPARHQLGESRQTTTTFMALWADPLELIEENDAPFTGLQKSDVWSCTRRKPNLDVSIDGRRGGKLPVLKTMRLDRICQ